MIKIHRKGFNQTRTTEEYKEFAESLGIREDHIILREYVKPLQTIS